uniref:Uncharacterized protein n=1 Tax=Rhizophora mucronata TaxID=61149 RepID=A0A2P2P2W4_RHIMU
MSKFFWDSVVYKHLGVFPSVKKYIGVAISILFCYSFSRGFRCTFHMDVMREILF